MISPASLANLKVFTPENASDEGKKGAAMRWAIQKAKDEARKTAPFAQHDQQQPITPILATNQPEFRDLMLKKIRAQIKTMLKLVDAELDKPILSNKVLRDLGEIIAKFEAMEQKLSMRAGPGSLKPTVQKPAKGRTAAQHAPEPQD